MARIVEKKLPFISQKLVELREAKGWTRYALAKESGVGYDAVHRLEAGRRSDPNWTTMVRLAAALEVSLDVFAEPPN